MKAAMVISARTMSTNVHEIIARWLNFIQFWLFPSVCIVCKTAGQPDIDLCACCRSALPQTENPCPGCALPLPPGITPGSSCGACLSGRKVICRTFAPFAWEEPVCGLVSQFKYRHKFQNARVLCELLLEQLHEAYSAHELPELLIPVPLHASRLRERGFNQALMLARQLGKDLDLPVNTNLVRRVRHTPPQQGLGARERRRNLNGAFALWGPIPKTVKSVAIIDDVCTTMTTVITLAKLLHRHARQPLDIHVWALARA